MRWDYGPLGRATVALYGQEQYERLKPCLRSYKHRSEYAKYHFQQAREILAPVVEGQTKNRMVELIFDDDEDSSAFDAAMFKAAAHVVACIQSMHAISDTVGHVMYFGLGLNLTTKLKEGRVTLKGVADTLDGVADVAPLIAMLKDLMEALDYIYLEAVVNQSKHRSIVDPQYILMLDKATGAADSHGLRLAPFEYARSGVSYMPQWVDDVLPREFARQSRIIVDMGQALNCIVLDRCTAGGIPVSV
jgi:hypothetical protein